jgi:hypothetical protein
MDPIIIAALMTAFGAMIVAIIEGMFNYYLSS